MAQAPTVLLEGDLASECILWLQRLLELEVVAPGYNPSSLELGRGNGEGGGDPEFKANQD